MKKHHAERNDDTCSRIVCFSIVVLVPWDNIQRLRSTSCYDLIYIHNSAVLIDKDLSEPAAANIMDKHVAVNIYVAGSIYKTATAMNLHFPSGNFVNEPCPVRNYGTKKHMNWIRRMWREYWSMLEVLRIQGYFYQPFNIKPSQTYLTYEVGCMILKTSLPCYAFPHKPDLLPSLQLIYHVKKRFHIQRSHKSRSRGWLRTGSPVQGSSHEVFKIVVLESWVATPLSSQEV